MIRTQISLTEEQMRLLRRESKRTGKSMAQLTREAIDRSYPDTERTEIIRRALAIAGRHRSDVDDLSENHDEYFVQAIEERIGRRPRPDFD
ncbi:MAG TPA: ribbon-helix-helix protein, CopG family [Acidimicrobiia bacterium]|nr:ribbon-helix-helix protein, CopG family [Acidimicrobiia bacterium]